MTDPLALISAYFEGLLITEEHFEQLVDWINEDPEHARLFAWYSIQDSQTRKLFACEQMQGLMEAGNSFDTVPETKLNDQQEAGDLLSQLLELEPDDGELEPVDITDQLRKRKLDDLQAMRRRKRRGHGAMPPRDDRRDLIIPRIMAFGGIAAALALAAVLFFTMRQDPSAVEPDRVVQVPFGVETVSVAIIDDQFDARWGDGSKVIRDGQPVSNEPLRLVSGTAMLRFENGAEFVIQAPAAIEPISSTRLGLTQGRIVGYCPPTAHGFGVQTPNALVIDRGTEFGVAVRDDGNTEVAVFSGAVDVSIGDPASGWSGNPQRLVPGDGVVVHDATRQVSRVPSESLAFTQRARQQGYEQAVLANRPIAFWRFNEPQGSTRLIDLGSLGAHGEFEGDPIAFATPGANPESTGSAVRGPGDSVALFRCGKHDFFHKPERLTVEGWVMLASNTDGKGNEYQVIFSTREMEIRGGGGLEIGVERSGRYSNTKNALFFSWPGLADWYCVGEGLTEDRWAHFAVTMDGADIQWYINGEARETKIIKSIFAPRDPADGGVLESGSEVILGKHPRDGRRFFYGSLDELAVFDRVLTPEQIRSHYSAGRP